jgi:hypothetical protein
MNAKQVVDWNQGKAGMSINLSPNALFAKTCSCGRERVRDPVAPAVDQEVDYKSPKSSLTSRSSIPLQNM